MFLRLTDPGPSARYALSPPISSEGADHPNRTRRSQSMSSPAFRDPTGIAHRLAYSWDLTDPDGSIASLRSIVHDALAASSEARRPCAGNTCKYILHTLPPPSPRRRDVAVAPARSGVPPSS